jgi:rhodanese-related sulfurtransferase
VSEPTAPSPARARRPGIAVLDCRDAAAFAAGHLPGAGHVPLEALEARRYELPPRDAALLVVADDPRTARAAAARIAALGYAAVEWLDMPWHALLEEAPDHGPAARLWRPSPFLEARLPLVPRGRALDLAAGAGREAVFLAMHGFEVEAIDHAEEALGWAHALATRHGVTITTRAMDLEAHGASLPEGRCALVTVFRFLHRPLLPVIAAALAPGGHLVYETFRRGQERFRRPTHPRFLFWPGELERAFPTLEIVAYEESDPPHGPVMARLHARRPASPGAAP